MQIVMPVSRLLRRDDRETSVLVLNVLNENEFWRKNMRTLDAPLAKKEPVDVSVSDLSSPIPGALDLPLQCHTPRYSRNVQVGELVPRRTGPIQLLNKILKTWRLDNSAAVALLGLEPADESYVADVLDGRKVLKGRDANDRLAYLILMRMALSAWFHDEAVENDWLREPQDMLDGKVPMDLLLEGSMENLLLVKEYIDMATGW